MELLLPEIGLLFWTLLAFLIVFFILKKYGWPAILKGLKDIKKVRDINPSSILVISFFDAKGKEIAKFNLSGDATLSGMCSMIFAEAYRREGTWKFRALGEPQATDNFVEILKKYINN